MREYAVATRACLHWLRTVRNVVHPSTGYDVGLVIPAIGTAVLRNVISRNKNFILLPPWIGSACRCNINGSICSYTAHLTKHHLQNIYLIYCEITRNRTNKRTPNIALDYSIYCYRLDGYHNTALHHSFTQKQSTQCLLLSNGWTGKWIIDWLTWTDVATIIVYVSTLSKARTTTMSSTPCWSTHPVVVVNNTSQRNELRHQMTSILSASRFTQTFRNMTKTRKVLFCYRTPWNKIKFPI